MQPTSDPSYFIRNSMQAVTTAALAGSVLAMIVVLLFLGSLRKSFVIGLSIPTTGRALVERLRGIDGLENFQLARDDRTPLLSVDVDRARAAALGLNVSEVVPSLYLIVDDVSRARLRRLAGRVPAARPNATAPEAQDTGVPSGANARVSSHS